VLTTESKGREASPDLYETAGGVFLGNHTIGEEVFGPPGVFVRVKSTDDMVHQAKSFECQQPVTLHMDKNDAASARKLPPFLERKAGRTWLTVSPQAWKWWAEWCMAAPTRTASISAQPASVQRLFDDFRARLAISTSRPMCCPLTLKLRVEKRSTVFQNGFKPT
jgi:hypothetical protein